MTTAQLERLQRRGVTPCVLAVLAVRAAIRNLIRSGDLGSVRLRKEDVR